MVKRTRRGFAGDDVEETIQHAEDVVPEEDQSYLVEGTDSPNDLEVENTIITDDHRVVTEVETGSEEDFVAESEDGDAEVIDEDPTREGRRRGVRKSRRGSRRGEKEEIVMDEDGNTEEHEVEDEDSQEREGRRRGVRKSRRGSRRGGDQEDHIDDVKDEIEDLEEELGDLEESREGRKGAYGGKSPEHQESIRAAVQHAMRDRRL